MLSKNLASFYRGLAVLLAVQLFFVPCGARAQTQTQTNLPPPPKIPPAISSVLVPEQGFVPGEVIVFLKTDNANVLSAQSSDETIRRIYAKYGVPKVKSLFGGSSATYWQNRQNKILQKYEKRARRRPKNATAPALNRFYLLTFNVKNETLPSVIDGLQGSNALASVSFNAYIKANAVPNDTYYLTTGSWGQAEYDLWGLRHIRTEDAWNYTTGSAGVTVAVIDTGLDMTHADISSQIWTNAAEVAGNGVDDDANGYVDDVHGYDFVNSDADPTDDNGHGTHMAGIIGAAGNNSQGITGVMWDSRIMPVKGLSSSGSGSQRDLLYAIWYAADNGADVINLSLGGDDDGLFYMTYYAWSLGAVVVASAGNDGSDSTDHYPAGHDWNISVASTGFEDALSSFSNYGVKTDLFAPGGDDSSGPSDNILSLKASALNFEGDAANVLGTDYLRSSGTSMSAAYVSGAVGLLISYSSTMTVEEIRQALRMGSRDVIDTGWDWASGYGRLNIEGSIGRSFKCEALIMDKHYDTEDAYNYKLVRDFFTGYTVNGYAGGSSFGGYQIALYQGFPDNGALKWSTPYPSSSTSTAVSNDALATIISRTSYDPGVYTIGLTVYDTVGNVCGRDYKVIQYSPDEPTTSFVDSGTVGDVGRSIAVGDINNDGKDDILVSGSKGATSTGGDAGYGSVFLIDGASVSAGLEQPVDSAAFTPYSWVSTQFDDRFGQKVLLTDFDGDGDDDVIISAIKTDYGALTAAGTVCIYLSKNRSTWTTNMDFTDADVCYYGENASDFLGGALTSGDFNNDGFKDLAVTADGNDNAGTDYGRIYVLYGEDVMDFGVSRSIALADAKIDGDVSCGAGFCNADFSYNYVFGESLSLAAVGDVNGDGFEDLAVGNPFASSYTGTVLLFYGSAGYFSATSFAGADVTIAEDEYARQGFGFSVGKAGDVNGDGFDDVLASHFGLDSSPDTVSGIRLLSGSSGLAGSQSASAVTMAYWHNTETSKTYGGTLGDINADGYDDILIGEPSYDEFDYHGIAYVKQGAASSLTSGDIRRESDFVLAHSQGGVNAENYLGQAFDVGDVNGDGKSELVIGAPGSIGRSTSSGVYIIPLQ